MLNLENIKEDLFDLMHVHWSNKMGFKPKLRNYTKFKQDLNVEDYLVKIGRAVNRTSASEVGGKCIVVEYSPRSNSTESETHGTWQFPLFKIAMKVQIYTKVWD